MAAGLPGYVSQNRIVPSFERAGRRRTPRSTIKPAVIEFIDDKPWWTRCASSEAGKDETLRAARDDFARRTQTRGRNRTGVLGHQVQRKHGSGPTSISELKGDRAKHFGQIVLGVFLFARA